MKTLLSILVAVTLGAFCAPSASAREPVSLDFFYDNLEPYGAWREVGDYGYCWQPRDVDQDWRPYSEGRWVYTDAGWTWDSDEPYGWAVYHYGRWSYVEQIGWVWIPGTEWGPGWVSWRHSPRYVGWAPLPPEAQFLRTVGLSAWVDDYYDIGPSNYCFVEGRDFGSRRLRSVFIDRRENFTIINQTTNITNITYQGDVVHNGGLRYDQQSRMSAEPIPRYKLDRRQDFHGDERRLEGDQFRSRVNGDSLSMLALPFVGKSSVGPRNRSDKVERAEVDRGWRGAGSQDEINAIREKLKSKVRRPDGLPPRPKFDKPGERDPQRPVTKPGKGNDTPRGPDATPAPPDATPAPPMKRPEARDRPPSPGNGDKPKKSNGPPSDGPKPEATKPMPDPQRPRTDDKPPMEKPATDKPQPPQERRPSSDKLREQRPDMKRPEAPNLAPEQRPQVKPQTPQERRPNSDKLKEQRPEMKRQEAPNLAPEQRPQVKPQPPQERRPNSDKLKEQRPEMKRPEAPNLAPEQRPQVRRPDPKPEARRPEPQKPAERPQMNRPESQPQPKRPEVQRPAPRPQAPPTVKPQQPNRKPSDDNPGDKGKKKKSED